MLTLALTRRVVQPTEHTELQAFREKRQKCLTRRVTTLSLLPVTQLTSHLPAPRTAAALELVVLLVVVLLGLVLITGGGPPLF